MTPEDSKKDEWKFDLCFGTRNPCLGHFPHLIIKKSQHDDKILQVIASTLGCPLGVWGDEPQVKADGQPYIAPEDGRVISDFVLWKLPRNQEFVLNPNVMGRSYGFRMHISTDTPPHVLERFYTEQRSNDDYYKLIEHVCGWINILNWVYIELSDETDYAIFVTSSQYQDLVRQVETAVTVLKVPTGKLVPNEGHFLWPDI